MHNITINTSIHGFYEHLHDYIGIGCNHKNNISTIVGNSDEIFKRDDALTDRLKNYTLELGYNIMISTSDNVSISPGFEVCLGTFGGK